MNKMMSGTVVLMMMGLLAGCSSDHIMHMRDGCSVVVQGKPHLDNATKMLVYTDATGRTQAVNLDDVQGSHGGKIDRQVSPHYSGAVFFHSLNEPLEKNTAAERDATD